MTQATALTTNEQTIHEMLRLSESMQRLATELMRDAHLAEELHTWHTAGDADTASFNREHNL
jgi:hypothetical protein